MNAARPEAAHRPRLQNAAGAPAGQEDGSIGSTLARIGLAGVAVATHVPLALLIAVVLFFATSALVAPVGVRISMLVLGGARSLTRGLWMSLPSSRPYGCSISVAPASAS